MKKLLALGLTIAAGVSLTACGDSISDELLTKFKEEVNNTLDSFGMEKSYSDLDGYISDNNYDETMAYNAYVVEHTVRDTLINEFALSLVDADLTATQLEAIITALGSTLEAFEEQDEEMLMDALVDALFNTKLSSDQLINCLYNLVQGLDDKIIDAIEAIEEKTNYSEVHAVVLSAMKTNLSGFDVLFDLTEEDRERDLVLCEFSLGNMLDYIYGLESSFDTLVGLTDGSTVLTKDTLTALIEANHLAFEDSFGNDTLDNYTKWVGVVVEANQALDENFSLEDLGISMTEAELAGYIYDTKESIGDVFELLTEDEYQSHIYSLITMSSVDSDTEGVIAYNGLIILADIILVAFDGDGLDGSELGLTELIDSAKGIATYDFFTLATLDGASDETLLEFEEFIDMLSYFMM